MFIVILYCFTYCIDSESAKILWSDGAKILVKNAPIINPMIEYTACETKLNSLIHLILINDVYIA